MVPSPNRIASRTLPQGWPASAIAAVATRLAGPVGACPIWSWAWAVWGSAITEREASAMGQAKRMKRMLPPVARHGWPPVVRKRNVHTRFDNQSSDAVQLAIRLGVGSPFAA